MHHDPYVKTKKQTRDPITITIIENGSTKRSFKTKPMWKRKLVQSICLKQYLNQKRIFHPRIQSAFITY